MTPALEQIKALPAKWREDARTEIPPDKQTEKERGFRNLLHRHADELDTALQALRDEAGEAYAAGWRQAARWAGRDDLLADIDSPAYEADKIAALHWPRPAPAAEAAPQGGDTPVRRYHFRMVSDHHAWGYHLIPAEDGAYCKYSEVRQVLLAAQLAATPPSAPAVEESDSLVIGECGWVDPATRDNDSLIACMVQNYSRAAHSDNRKQYAAYQACQRELIRRLSAPVPQEGVDEAMVLVPRELLSEVEEQLVDLCNEKTSNHGIYREREKLHDADVLQQVRLLLAAAPAQGVR